MGESSRSGSLEDDAPAGGIVVVSVAIVRRKRWR